MQNHSEIAYPVGTKDVHHEIEMVVAIGKGGKNIAVEKALEHVWGYAVGLDMTRRDIQGEAKKQGRPWEMGKSFDESAPVTALRPASEIGHPAKGAIWVKVNGTLKQQGDVDGAIEALQHSVALDDLNAAAWNNLGLLLRRKGDKAGAEDAFAKAATIRKSEEQEKEKNLEQGAKK